VHRFYATHRGILSLPCQHGLVAHEPGGLSWLPYPATHAIVIVFMVFIVLHIEKSLNISHPYLYYKVMRMPVLDYRLMDPETSMNPFKYYMLWFYADTLLDRLHIYNTEFSTFCKFTEYCEERRCVSDLEKMKYMIDRVRDKLIELHTEICYPPGIKVDREKVKNKFIDIARALKKLQDFGLKIYERCEPYLAPSAKIKEMMPKASYKVTHAGMFVHTSVESCRDKFPSLVLEKGIKEAYRYVFDHFQTRMHMTPEIMIRMIKGSCPYLRSLYDRILHSKL